ncbi:hypothetical protein K438DRAFT_1861635, partial [Mycena galopus ATCC 62051]
YFAVIFNGCFKFGEVFQLAAGNAVTATPTAENTTAWSIPFDSLCLRSPLYPTSIHVTAVVLKYQSIASSRCGSFRGFVQERVALARRWIEKNGPDALADWGWISLFDGCRKSTQDFLYKEEWPQYSEELKGKFSMHCNFSREPP